MLSTCAGPMHFTGTVATVSGDNPGSGAVGGFKEATSAFRPCRQCMGTKDMMMTKVQLCIIHILYYKSCVYCTHVHL